MKEFNKKIVLEDGEEYYGYGFGADKESISEIMFNTSMVGYQELVSDPSCTNQAVVMTYPLIGNYGITDEDYETKQPTIGGLIVREYNNQPSNFRYTKTLSEYLEENNIPGISGIDTRKLVRKIRNNGTQKVIITDIETPKEHAVKKLNEYSIPKDVVSRVSCKKKWYSRTANPKFNIVAIDCGIKLNIIKNLNKRGCNVTVVPYNTTAEEIKNLKPDGIIISNGPGNPEDVTEVISLVKDLKGKYPMLGISLGHQIICLAYGAKTQKLRFGHIGGNHPVLNLETDKIEIISQGHNYTVLEESINKTNLKITHKDILNNTIEGVESKKDKVLSVQYHPESAPGPQDSEYIFDKFIEMIGG